MSLVMAARPLRSLLALGVVVLAAVALPASTGATSLTEVKKLTASDAQVADGFGFTVAVSGDTGIVGALGEDTGGSDAGAAYVFKRDQGGADNWGEVKKLIASDAQTSDGFAIGVAVSGDTAIVGAHGEDAGGFSAGAAYIFQRNEGGMGNWGELKKVIASDAFPSDDFGHSVAISGDTAIVGAPGEDDGSPQAGAVYILQRDQGGADNWGEVKKLIASDGLANAEFGRSAAINGDIIVVGALTDNAQGLGAGAAYIFQRNEGGAGNWGEVKKLIPSDAQAGDHIGASVAVSGDTAVVSADLEDTGGVDAGAAYVYQRDQGGADNWGQVKKLTASDAQANDRFAIGVAVSGDTAVVGAYLEDAGGNNAGAVYVFQRDQGGADSWGETKKIIASDAQAGPVFGFSVAVSGDTAFVGAPSDSEAAIVAGAAYVFQEPTPPPPVGGVSLDSDLRPLPLETTQHSSPPRAVFGFIGAASLLALAGAAWYGKRRSLN